MSGKAWRTFWREQKNKPFDAPSSLSPECQEACDKLAEVAWAALELHRLNGEAFRALATNKIKGE